MEFYERVNAILKDKKLTKRAFAKILIDLHPVLKTTGEPPVEGTVYGYLNGSVSIPIELISYIAEALDIVEQDLFDDSLKSQERCLKSFINKANNKQLEYFNTIINSKISNSNINISYGNIIISEKDKTKNIEKLLELIEYVPQNVIDKLIIKFEEYRKLSEDII
jgi:transcriptional regulator with XRE-family HTH domain